MSSQLLAETGSITNNEDYVSTLKKNTEPRLNYPICRPHLVAFFMVLSWLYEAGATSNLSHSALLQCCWTYRMKACYSKSCISVNYSTGQELRFWFATCLTKYNFFKNTEGSAVSPTSLYPLQNSLLNEPSHLSWWWSDNSRSKCTTK